MSKNIILLTLTSALLLAKLATAANVTFESYKSERSPCGSVPYQHICIEGRLDAATPELFRLALLQAKKSVSLQSRLPVYFNSEGGELLPAIELGRMIENSEVRTGVASDAHCLSACVYPLFAAQTAHQFRSILHQNPRLREIKIGGVSSVGVHRPQFQLNNEEAKILRELNEAEKWAQMHSLIGHQMNELYAFLEREAGNDLLLQYILSSPSDANDYNYIDSFEEAYLLGIDIRIAPASLTSLGGRYIEEFIVGYDALTFCKMVVLAEDGIKNNVFIETSYAKVPGDVILYFVPIVRDEKLCVVKLEKGTYEVYVYLLRLFEYPSVDSLSTPLISKLVDFFYRREYFGSDLKKDLIKREIPVEYRSAAYKGLIDEVSRLDVLASANFQLQYMMAFPRQLQIQYGEQCQEPFPQLCEWDQRRGTGIAGELDGDILPMWLAADILDIRDYIRNKIR